jgi:hypothetical protein
MLLNNLKLNKPALILFNTVMRWMDEKHELVLQIRPKRAGDAHRMLIFLLCIMSSDLPAGCSTG